MTDKIVNTTLLFALQCELKNKDKSAWSQPGKMKHFSQSYKVYNHIAHNQLDVECLTNRKQVPCFFRAIETRVETGAAGECFHSFFEFSQTFTSVSVT